MYAIVFCRKTVPETKPPETIGHDLCSNRGTRNARVFGFNDPSCTWVRPFRVRGDVVERCEIDKLYARKHTIFCDASSCTRANVKRRLAKGREGLPSFRRRANGSGIDCVAGVRCSTTSCLVVRKRFSDSERGEERASICATTFPRHFFGRQKRVTYVRRTVSRAQTVPASAEAFFFFFFKFDYYLRYDPKTKKRKFSRSLDIFTRRLAKGLKAIFIFEILTDFVESF